MIEEFILCGAVKHKKYKQKIYIELSAAGVINSGKENKKKQM